MKLNIERAFASYFAKTGKQAEQKFLKEEWPKSSKKTAEQNFRNIKKGRNKMKVDTLIRLCKITETTPNDFLGWEN